MHMHNGLGRTGYVLLAFVLLAIGGLGLAATYYAYVDGTLRFFQIGLGLAGFGLVALFGFAAWAPWIGGTPRGAAPSPAASPGRTAAATPAASPGPALQAAPSRPAVEFEFDNPQPAAKAAPESLVLPNAFARDGPPGASAADPTAWPARRGKAPANEWTSKVEHRRKIEQMVEESPVRQEMAERYTRTTPQVRGILQEPPLHVAERAPPGVEPGFAAPGMSVGQCGRCRTVVMAPDARPIRLKCPQCAKVTLLN